MDITLETLEKALNGTRMSADETLLDYVNEVLNSNLNKYVIHSFVSFLEKSDFVHFTNSGRIEDYCDGSADNAAIEKWVDFLLNQNKEVLIVESGYSKEGRDFLTVESCDIDDENENDAVAKFTITQDNWDDIKPEVLSYLRGNDPRVCLVDKIYFENPITKEYLHMIEGEDFYKEAQNVLVAIVERVENLDARQTITPQP